MIYLIVMNMFFILPNGEKPKDLHGCFELLLKDCNLLEDSDGQNRTLYSIRHTYATIKLLEGKDIYMIALQMGTSVGMIEKTLLSRYGINERLQYSWRF